MRISLGLSYGTVGIGWDRIVQVRIGQDRTGLGLVSTT